MLTDDEIIDELRRAVTVETAEIDPRPGLLGRIHQELAATTADRRRRSWPRLHTDALVVTLAGGVAIAIAVIALVFLHHRGETRLTQTTSAAAVGAVNIAAQAPDPHGGLPWGLRTTQTQRLRACLQLGRLRAGEIGALGQDGAFGDDGRFHPIPLASNFPCARTDARGNLFLNVLEEGIPASASQGKTAGCQIEPTLARLRGQPSIKLSKHPACPTRDLRNLAFGALGPSAVSITYSLNHHTITERTGPDGAYLVVVPGTGQLCTSDAQGGKQCFGGSGGGEITTSTLQAGILTSVTYRNGHVCRLETTSNGSGGARCPNVDYAHYPPFHPPRVNEAQVKAPMTVRMFTAKHYCYKPLAVGSFEIPCDHGVPRGAKPASRDAYPSIALVDISFTARLAANNHRTVYEFSYGRAAGPASCTINTGGTDATTMVPIRAGQRVTIQDDQERCRGTYKGVVTYQPNGGPGRDTLSFSNPIRDHSVLVGRFSYVLR